MKLPLPTSRVSHRTLLANGLPDTRVGALSQAMYGHREAAGLDHHQHEERLEAHL